MQNPVAAHLTIDEKPKTASGRTLAEIIKSPTEAATIIIEAHDGLSARIVEQAGFEAIWASGFSISTALGLRDCNEVSCEQLLDVIKIIRHSSRLPILIDGDSGFGDQNTIDHFVRKASMIGADGICIEDKTYPKRNSFIEKDQNLVSIEEHCARLYAAHLAREDDSFLVVARTESFIAGVGMDEALRRSQAYLEAGADAIFIHSKAVNADQIRAFARQWRHRAPLIIAPTTFPDICPKQMAEIGVNVIIAANQLVRAAMGAMQVVARQIFLDQSVMVNVPPMQVAFELLGYQSLE